MFAAAADDVAVPATDFITTDEQGSSPIIRRQTAIAHKTMLSAPADIHPRNQKKRATDRTPSPAQNIKNTAVAMTNSLTFTRSAQHRHHTHVVVVVIVITTADQKKCQANGSLSLLSSALLLWTLKETYPVTDGHYILLSRSDTRTRRVMLVGDPHEIIKDFGQESP